MKISDPNLNAVTTSAQQSGRTSAAGVTARGGSTPFDAAKSDRVQISDLSSLLKSIAADSAERQSKVSQLADAYKNGTYQVNSATVGKSLVADALTK